MVRKRRKSSRPDHRLSIQPNDYLSVASGLVEIFRFLAEGSLMMACGIVVGLALGQAVGNVESKTTLAFVSGGLFVLGIISRLIGRFLEACDVRHR